MQGPQDTSFFPEVWPTTKVSYVFIEVPMKGRVSFDHKPPWAITKIKFSSLLSNPHEGESNTNFLGITPTLVPPGEHLIHLSDKCPIVMNTRRLLVKCSCMKVEWATQDLSQITPRRLGFYWSLWECWSSKILGGEFFQVNGVAKWAKGVETPFYSP
jgi:hypothetical protein